MNFKLVELTRNSIIKKIVASLLIVALTMVNFIIVGIETVSYAIDAFEVGTATNNKNVTFDSYFKDTEGKILTEKEEKIDSKDMKLFVQVSVKNDGYFNGQILLEEGNFKLKNEILSAGINKIEGNSITLNQINSGETLEIEVGIEPLREDIINSDFLSMESKISIKGIYKNSKEKDINISAERSVKLNLVNPYEADGGVELSSKIITNKIYNINNENKRIVQLLVESGLKDNAYPIKENNIEISVPTETENVTVISRGMLSSNGKSETEFNSDDWSYVKDENKVKVSIKNEVQNDTIKWIKSGNDKIIVTYILKEGTDMQDTTISVNNTITLLDTNKTIKEANTTSKIEDEKDGVISSGIELKESSIYKGKLYSNENREYEVLNNVYVNEAETGKNINIELLPSKYEIAEGELNSNIQYTRTLIAKSEITRVLGTNGTLRIVANDGTKLAEIDNNTAADENGNIVINYPDGIQTLKIETSTAVETGTISLKNTKTIKYDDNSREIKAKYLNIVEKTSEEEAKILLQESTTSAKIQTNKSSLSTMTKNTGTEIIATLMTNKEENDLYKNPNIKIQLPPQVENVEINSVKLLYEDEMKIENSNLHEENGVKVIEINLTGEQTKHTDGNVEGATIIINANLTLNKKATNSNESFKMTCTNQYSGVAIELEQPIEVVSPRGMVTINSIDEFGISAIGEENTKVSKLDLGVESKEAKVDIEVINNNEETVNNVKILGEFPTKNDVNTIETTVTEIEVTGAEAKVYYTENENANENIEDNSNGWSTELRENSAVKKYLIAVDNMEQSQDIKATYRTSIPENLQYNEQAFEGYKVLYSNANTSNEVEATTLGLSTGKGPELKSTLKAKLGNTELENGAEIAQGEVLKYEITVENTGTETATNVKVSSIIPEGTVYVEPKDDFVYADGYYNELTDKKDVLYEIESIAAGEKITKSFEVKVTRNAQANTELENKASVNYGEAKIESETIKNKVVEGSLSVVIKRATDLSVENYRGEYIDYFIGVQNISDKTQKDVTVNLNMPEELKIIKMYLINGENDEEEIEISNSIKIDEINVGDTIYINAITELSSLKNIDEKEVSIYATASIKNSRETKSNEFIEILKDFKLAISLSANNENGYLKSDDIIEYTLKIQNNSSIDSSYVDIKDIIPEQLSVQAISINGEEEEVGNNNVVLVRSVPANSSIEAKIKTIVDYDEERTEPVVITNVANIYDGSDILSSSEEITHILQAEKIDEDPDNPDNPDNPDKPTDPKNRSYKGLVSGTAWLDENQNGQRDSDETLLDGISVKLIDTSGNTVKAESGKEVAATTNSKGFYMLSDVPNGEYLVVFDYDTSTYAATAYQKEGVTDSKNSDVIVKQLTVDGEQKNVGVTNTIEVKDNGISNIDLGLMTATKFDLELNKYISKIVVQTKQETKTYNYDKSTLAKAEIAAKQLQGSTVIIEYQIEVKNTGEVAGYVKNIVDYMPASLKFSSELNNDWYQSGTNLFNTSLANTKLEAGETRIIPLTLTKTMTEENTGLVNNKAEIAESYNEAGIKDIDSTAGNKVQNEDDMGSADVIIGVKTGAMVTYIGLTMSVIILIGTAAYLLKRKMDSENNIEVNF